MMDPVQALGAMITTNIVMFVMDAVEDWEDNKISADEAMINIAQYIDKQEKLLDDMEEAGILPEF